MQLPLQSSTVCYDCCALIIQWNWFPMTFKINFAHVIEKAQPEIQGFKICYLPENTRFLCSRIGIVSAKTTAFASPFHDWKCTRTGRSLRPPCLLCVFVKPDQTKMMRKFRIFKAANLIKLWLWLNTCSVAEFGTFFCFAALWLA